MSNSKNTPQRAQHANLEKTELLNMLDAVITKGGGLLSIHHILNDARSMADIRARFGQWQTEWHDSKLDLDYAARQKHRHH